MAKKTTTIRMIGTGGRAPGRRWLIGARFTELLTGGDYMFAFEKPVEILAEDLPFFLADEHAEVRGRRQFEEVIQDRAAGRTADAKDAEAGGAAASGSRPDATDGAKDADAGEAAAQASGKARRGKA